MRGLFALLLSIPLLAAPGAVWAQALVVDLSRNLVPITTGFTGTDVVLFGATDGEGDVAIVVRGPVDRVTVREKEPTAGIWINRREATFGNVPGYYRVASSRPLDQIAPPALRQRHGIGLDQLGFELIRPEQMNPEDQARFRAALIRNKQAQGLYGLENQEASVMGNRLFRASIDLPANVPTGLYSVDAYLIRDGEIFDARSSSLIVSKVGLSADISEFAVDNDELYAVVVLLIAVGAGWLAALIFRES